MRQLWPLTSEASHGIMVKNATGEADIAIMSERVLGKGLEILADLALAPDGLTSGELALKYGIDKSTVYRYLKILKNHGFVKKDGNAHFQLGLQILELGNYLLQRMPIHTVAHPYLIDLSTKTGKPVHLCVLEGSEIVCIDVVEANANLHVDAKIGIHVPAYCTATGKVLLSALPPQHIDLLITEGHLVPCTARSISSVPQLRVELQATAERGYGLNNGESQFDEKSIAMGIKGHRGNVIAAVSLARLDCNLESPDCRQQFLPLLSNTADQIARAFRYSAEDTRNASNELPRRKPDEVSRSIVNRTPQGAEKDRSESESGEAMS